MTQGIIITTCDKTSPFLNDLLQSLQGCKYPIIIIKYTENDSQWETGGIYLGSTIFDEFVYLHDTVFIKDLSLFDMMFKEHQNKSVSLLKRYNSYLGKYRLEILMKSEMPVVTSKQEAIKQEYIFNNRYIELEQGNYIELFPELDGWETEHTNFKFKHGRNNVVYENDFFIKYKGTWKPDMVGG